MGLDALPPAVDTATGQDQLLRQHRGRFAFADPAQSQDHSTRSEIAARAEGAGVEIVDPLAVLTAVVHETPLAGAKVARVLRRGSTARAAQSCGMKIRLHPPSVLLFVQ